VNREAIGRQRVWAVVLVASVLGHAGAALAQKRYYAHDAVEDGHGVIAPWYRGQDGQLACRVRIGAETLKRYPWSDPAHAAAQIPEYLWSSFWSISPQGKITPGRLTDWMNGDRGQLAMYVLTLMPEYYRYSGDPAAPTHALMEAEIVLKYGLTPADHPWPSFPVSVPVKGRPYGPVDPRGMIQLDIAGLMGYGLLRTYQMTGEERLLTAARHWADVFAMRRDYTPGRAPWGRYANPEAIAYSTSPGSDATKLTGGIVWILCFLDEVIRLGHAGVNGEVVTARDAGLAYLKDVLLPAWTANDTWGRQYWDWENPTQVPNVTAAAAKYMMDHKDLFPNWRNDCRNIMSLCLNRVCVNPKSNGDVLSGTWAAPESCGCCGRCLTAMPGLIADAWARYGVEADSEWAREIARRMMILFTYDFHPNGVAEDNVDGGVVTNDHWFESAHLMPMRTALGALAWLPESLGSSRENHIMRSSSVVTAVSYGKGGIEYATFDAPAGTVDVLRLAFEPESIRADGRRLEKRNDLDANGYAVKGLGNGDCMVTVRHDGCRRIRVDGDDGARLTDDTDLTYDGQWQEASDADDHGGHVRTADKAGASASARFVGNQVQVLGRVGPEGGLADVYVDGVKQPAGIDCWSPLRERHRQVLYYTSGLRNARHELRLVVRGDGNPRSNGARVCIDAVRWSDAAGDSGFGEGGGPTGPQRMIFGYTRRTDYRDSAGNDWWPGCEFVVRSGPRTDSVQESWWTRPTARDILGTNDPELYRYGVHASAFTVYFTVGPGTYRARLRFVAASERSVDWAGNRISVFINEKKVVEDMDVAARAGGMDRAMDLVFNDLAPLHGTIAIHFVGQGTRAEGRPVRGEAFVHAIEIEPETDRCSSAPRQ
jgi:hypothetical protein